MAEITPIFENPIISSEMPITILNRNARIAINSPSSYFYYVNFYYNLLEQNVQMQTTIGKYIDVSNLLAHRKKDK